MRKGFLAAFVILSSIAALAQLPEVRTAHGRRGLDVVRQLMREQKFHEAVDRARLLVKEDSHSDEWNEGMLLLVECLVEQQDFAEAYSRAHEIQPSSLPRQQQAELFFFRGLAAYQTGRFDEAIGSFTQSMEADPSRKGTAESLFWQAMAEIALGRIEQAEARAMQAYSVAANGTPPSVSLAMGRDHALLLWGVAAERRGDFEQARQRYESLIRNFPASGLSTEASVRLGSLSLRRGDGTQALQYLESVKSPTRDQLEESEYLRAEAEFTLGRYEKARDQFQQFLNVFPESFLARQATYGLGWSSLRLGRVEEAAGTFEKLSAGTDSVAQAALYQAGILRLLQGNVARALELFERVTSQFPYERYADNAYYQMGLIHYRANRFAEARRHFQFAARLFPESELRAESFRMLAESSVALGDFSTAHYGFSSARQFAKPGDEVFASSFLGEGIALYRLGRFSSSIERLRDFVQQIPAHPQTAEGTFWLAEALYQDGRYPESERYYAQALEAMGPASRRRGDALYGLAWTQFEQKKFRQAIATFERFGKEYPDHPRGTEARLRMADSYFFLREFERAETLYASISEQGTNGQQAEYAAMQTALSLIERGNVQRGVDRLKAFLQRFPTSPFAEVAQFNIAWAYFASEAYERALQEFITFRELHPESQLTPRVALNMGDSYYNLSKFDSARTMYRKVIEEFPQSLLVPDAINGLQFSYQKEGKGAEAVAVLDELLGRKTMPGQEAELYMRKGDLLFNSGDFSGAVLEYFRALDRTPGPDVREKTLYQLGRAYELENNPARAIQYFSTLATEFPNGALAHRAILAAAYVHIRQKQWGPAVQLLKNFEERFPQSALVPEALYQLGIAFMGLNDSARARDQFVKLMLMPSTDQIFADRSRLSIARMHFNKKEYAAAIDTLNVIVNRRDDEVAAEALLMLGENRLALRQPAEALQEFLEVIESFGDFPLFVERAQMGAGECYERLNDRTKAREMYTKVLETAADPQVKKDAEERLRRIRR